MRQGILFALLLPTLAWANLFHVGPYLQRPGSNQMIVKWEADKNKSFSLKYGISKDQLNQIGTFSTEKLQGKKIPPHRALYKAQLKGLTSNKRYFYQISNGSEVSPIYSFKTFPQGKRNFSFLALSDGQNGYKATERVVRESLMPHAFDNPTLTKGFPVEMALFAGDLVQNGASYGQWKKHFFDPLAPILKRIPVIPVIGNHEMDHRLYFSFFDLPENGFKEHWYFFDLGNVRFIGLDTNTRYRKKVQLDWLKEVLDDAHKKGIDFVVGYFHHPHESELWLLGNTKFSGKIQRVLEDFSIKSEIPTVHLCGHTHGYSRGHSLRANHSMITVASIGGKLDQWGKHRQRDYLEYLVSLDQYGWVMGEVETGVNPTLTFKRFSYGDAHSFYDMGIKDEFTLKRYNEAPNKPVIKETLVKDGGLSVTGNEFVDPDSDGHLTTHLQISKNNFKSVKYEDYIHFQNVYFGEDKNRHKSMTDIMVSRKLPVGKGYKARIRYRDKALGWSEWSNSFSI
ncbi:MAG: hypothetical protein E2O68_02735 [Deltaproteobacteria bacterium]|nr:MAG: hypothetical protein E2O68_02735 [Deltaproteobacteria bacterium]